MQNQPNRGVAAFAAIAALAVGLGAGYAIWGWPTNWYAREVAKLPPGAEGDLIRYGHTLIIDTASNIGKGAANPEMRLAGNNLACVNCHLDAGLKPFAAPFVSTFATFPMLVDDQVLTLTERINGCKTRSLNGTALPSGGKEMNVLIAYIKYVGQGTPQGVRIAGTGLRPLRAAAAAPDGRRGEVVYAKLCASCHKADGQGELRGAPRIGYSIPPLWGDESFNAGAGMSRLQYAAAYIHDNMPFGVNYREPVLTDQQAWDVAAYMTAQPRPAAPPKAASPLP